MAKPVAEVTTDNDLVRALLREQHPDVSEEPIEQVTSGWDNDIYRLGTNLVVRLPRREEVVSCLENERRWGPVACAGLPLPTSLMVRFGRPGCGYPWPWSISRWFPGSTMGASHLGDQLSAAETIATFLAAFHRPSPPGAPRNPYRGVPLADRTARFDEGLAELACTSVLDEEAFDVAHVRAAWAAALTAPPWTGPPVWLHGDIHPLNVIVDEGAITAVIDLVDLCCGDPASDLVLAWMSFDGPPREHFRRKAGQSGAVDAATWQRAWGWAIALGVACANGDDRVRRFGVAALRNALADPHFADLHQ